MSRWIKATPGKAPTFVLMCCKKYQYGILGVDADADVREQENSLIQYISRCYIQHVYNGLNVAIEYL